MRNRRLIAYHDFLLAQGLLSPDLLERAVMEGFVQPRMVGQKRAAEGGLPPKPPSGGRRP